MKKATAFVAPYDAFKGNPLEIMLEVATRHEWSKVGLSEAKDDRIMWTVGEEGFTVYCVQEENDDSRGTEQAD